MITLIYTNKRGTSVMRAFDDPDKAAKFMSNLRCEATARNSLGREIGWVWRLDRADRPDGRRKWGWLIDTEDTSAPGAISADEDEFAEVR